MRLLSTKAYVGLAATVAVTAIGFWAGGFDLAVYAALAGGLCSVVGLLWIETHRLRRAQATRTNRIGKRLNALERETSQLRELVVEQQERLLRRMEELHAEGARGLTAGVEQVLDAETGNAEQLRRLREEDLGPLSSRTELLLQSAAKADQNQKRIVKEQNRVLYAKFDDLLALYRDIEPEQALPALHGWAVGPDFARLLYTEVLDNKRTHVVECGSGSTTVILAYAMRVLGLGRVTSLEHDPRYAAATRHLLAERGLSQWAEVVDAPLVDVDIDGTAWRWYDPAKLPGGAIDLLLVDGPPGPTGPHARYPAMPMLADRLSANAVVMLDDAYRKDEQEIGKRWKSEFKWQQAKTVQNDYGTLVLRRGPLDL